jgi:phosphohistidine swiveling domain-containing protein
MIRKLEDIAPGEDYGGKANKLGEMLRNGFPVPHGSVIEDDFLKTFLSHNPELSSRIETFHNYQETEQGLSIHKAFETALFPESMEKSLKDILDDLRAKGYKSAAVRSSGNKEDGGNYSFAGQFESFLNVRDHIEVCEAIKKCWASLYGEKVLAYCRNNGIDHKEFKLNVIVQGLVESEYAGVVFTANPLTGKDTQMVIEAVAGFGEAMVQGSVMPDLYLSDWYNGSVEIKRMAEQDRLMVSSNQGGLEWKSREDQSSVLDMDQIHTLTELCLGIQQYYGEPLDIEWAYAHGRFHVLQARPLTSIQFDTTNDWTNADLKDGGISSSITTPMMYSLYEFIFEHTMPAYFKQLNILPKKHFEKWFTSWFGYSYWNMEAAKEGAKLIPGFVERNFDMSLGIEPNYQGNGHVTKFTPSSIIRGIRILLASNRSIRNRKDECIKTIQNMDRYFQELEQTDWDKMDLDGMIKVFGQMIQDKYLQMEGLYFYTIYDNSNAATFCQEKVDKENKKRKDKINYLNLVAGLSDLSHLRPSYDLWVLSRSIREDMEAMQYFTDTTSKSIAEDLSGNHSFPFNKDVSEFITIYGHHSLRELDLLVPNWSEDPTQAIEMLKSFIRMDDEMSPLEHNKKQAEVSLKEISSLNNKSLLKKVNMHRELLWWREEMRDYSSRFYAQIRVLLIKIGTLMKQEGKLDEVEDVFFLTFQQLLHYQAFTYRETIHKNRIFYRSFRHFKQPNEILRKQGRLMPLTTDHPKDTFIGTAGSGGIVKGRAILIENIYSADQILEGDILVTKFTDPAWTPYFSRIIALVTETGGILSHGAVVSREYGIPAVLAVKNICKQIHTGDIIEVDGYSGSVKLIQKNDYGNN